jgi:hypothetical protein
MLPALSCGRVIHELPALSATAAVVGPITTPQPSSPESYLLTTEPQGPAVLLPTGANISNVAAPDAVLHKNCSLISYNSTGKVVYATPVPSPEPVGPCRLVMSPNGTLLIRDLGNGNATVWSNELLANRTTLTGEASCAPYSLAVLSTGALVEKDCANRTVWFAPPLAGGAGNSTPVWFVGCRMMYWQCIWASTCAPLPVANPNQFSTVSAPVFSGRSTIALPWVPSLAAVVGPVPGPGPTSNSTIGLILTTEPQGPYALLPSGTTNTTSPKPPDAVLLENCSLATYDGTGKVVYSTSVPASIEPVGPCQLIMDKNGTLYIRDLGTDGQVVWSNELQTNRTAATCSPYSLAVLPNGVLVEKDCANKTVWTVPQTAGQQHSRVKATGRRTVPGLCVACSLNMLSSPCPGRAAGGGWSKPPQLR